MFFRVFLIITGIVSFIYFLNPEILNNLREQGGEVLGVNQINAQVNQSTIDTALTAYCLKNGELPEDLNQLFGSYLDEKIKIDLTKLYKYKINDSKNCIYQLF